MDVKLDLSLSHTRTHTHTKGRTLRVFQNRVLRRVFGLERKKVGGRWRRLHNEDFQNLYKSQNIIREIMSRRMK
jgi:hypothetical protein